MTDYPLRVNISFELSAPVLEKVVAANMQVVRAGNKDIAFGSGGSAIPHLTLLMGDLSSTQDFDALLVVLLEFAKEEEALQYKVSKPYLKQPSRNFIFADVEPSEVFRSLRYRLFERVRSLLAIEHHGGPNNVSHITLGYARPPLSTIENVALELRGEINGVASVLALSRVGNRGTCVEKLARFPLAE